MTTGRGMHAVLISATLSPDARPSVLLQFEYGYLLVSTSDARQLALQLLITADEADAIAPVEGNAE